MIIKKKLKKIGTSLGVIIDKIVLETLDLKEGEIIELNIKKVTIK